MQEQSRKQDKLLEDAESKIQTFLAGDMDARIANDEEGDFPKNESEIAVSENYRRQFSKEIGDTVSLVTPAGSFEYVISGIAKDGTLLQRNDAIGVFVSMESFEKIAKENMEDAHPAYYIQFGNVCCEAGEEDFIPYGY